MSEAADGGPTVTVLVPMRDEAEAIERCLQHLAAQTWPADDLEVVVVDGGSTDGSADVVRAVLARTGFARGVVVAGRGPTPANLNDGLAHARGRLLCRVDARSLVPPGYVAACVEVLQGRSDVAVTGGCQVAVPREATSAARGIARGLNNRWGMGLSRYRRGAASGPADTVYLGAFRTAQLRDVGGWDERLATNQDFDLNRRMGRHGLVWVQGDLPVGYLPRARVGEVFRQYRRFGRWKVRYWRMTGDRPRPRQVALLAGPPAAALGVVALAVRSPRLGVLAGIAGLVGLAVVEHRGASEPEGGVAAHAAATGTLLAVGAGWTLGVWEEVVTRER